MKNLLQKAKAKYLAAGIALGAPLMAMADVDPKIVPYTSVASELEKLNTGIVAVGGAVLGIAITSVGFFVIRRMVNRA